MRDPMIQDTIAQIEAQVRAAESLPPEKRRELEELLAELRQEVAALPGEARRASPAPVRLEGVPSPISRLEQSLTGFEATHPEVIGMVNRISTILANMGI